MDALPMMQERKKKIDMHVSIAHKMLNIVKQRSTVQLSDFEDEIMGG
jgi:hypothetical protein